MKKYYRELVRDRLLKIFDEADAETVLTWMISNDGRRPVVVVGAGFTLNAELKGTGLPVSTKEVPLWRHILERFTRDLRVPENVYEALTLAELYYEEMGPATFHSTLLSMLHDDDLLPGRAHRELFSYPAEAIVTTNLLDTVLDHNGHNWLRIVHDEDLALLRDKSAQIELIYFHGHRCDRSSWVFTRSQYEDMPRRRPLIVTKVRQLLSQNPVLIVGYGLSDPDFHHIYRQISLEMSYRHPLGLALFPFGRGPTTPERRHWEKLGIRIATFKKGTHIGDAFASFFQINPTPNPTDDLAAIEGIVARASDFEERRSIAEDFLRDLHRASAAPASRHEEYHKVWFAVLRSEFTPEEWKAIDSIREDDQQYATSTALSPAVSGQSTHTRFTGYNVLPRERFGPLEQLWRRIDAFLTRQPLLKRPLAEWMTFALKEDLVDDGKPQFLDLLSWLWTDIAQHGGEDLALREIASGVVRQSLTISNRYGYALKHIQSDADVLGVGNADAASDRDPRFLKKMEMGYRAMLDGAFDEARLAYQEANDIAEERQALFDQWVALNGAAQASWAMRPLDSITSSNADALKYRHRINALAESPEVKHWLAQARVRRDRVNDKVIEQFAKSRRDQMFGGKSFAWDNYAHHYWTTFRDLEAIFAAPQQQRDYLEPLISLGGFATATQFRYRLMLGVGKAEDTKNWLARILDDHDCSPEERDERDAEILNEFRKDDLTKTERARRLKAFVPFARVLKVEDLDWSLDFLRKTRVELGKSIRTSSSFSVLSHEYAAAWGEYAELETRIARGCNNLAEYVAAIDNPLEAETFARALRSAPLSQWIGIDASAADTLLAILNSLEEKCDGEARSQVDLLWSYYAVAEGARRFAVTLKDTRRGELLARVDRVLDRQREAEPDSDFEDYRATVHLGLVLLNDTERRHDLAHRVLVKIEELLAPQDHAVAQSATATRRQRDIEAPMNLWYSLVEADVGPHGGEMARIGTAVWRALDEQWTTKLDFLTLNPHYAWPYAQLLAEVLASELGEPARVRQQLLDVLRAAPARLSACGNLLEPRFWGDRWGDLVQLVMAGAAGFGSDSFDGRIGTIDLLGRWLLQPGQRDLTPDLAFIIDVSFLGVLDPRPAIANHAAYNVIRLGKRGGSDALCQRVIDTLRRMARDPRLSVQGAAVYASTALQRQDLDVRIQAAASELGTTLSNETYAVLQRQRIFGQLDRDVPE